MTETKYYLTEGSEDLSKTYPYNLMIDVYGTDFDLDTFSPKLIKAEMEKVLNETDIKVLELRYNEKLSLEAISEILDIDCKSIEKRQAVAIRILRGKHHLNNMRYFTYAEFKALTDAIENLKAEIEDLEERLNQYTQYAENNSILNTNINDIEVTARLSTRAYNCILRGAIFNDISTTTVGDLANLVNNDFTNFMRIRNLGKKIAKEILTFLDDNGLLIGEEAKEFLKR